MPKVSVCSSSYNHEKYVSEAVQSVLDQTLQDFELIITDDFSTDKTVEKIQQFDDPRITLFRHESNRGNMVASENCFKHSRGEYIAWLTTDDVYEPHMLATLSQHLDKNRDLLGVFGQPSFIDEDGNPIDYDYPTGGEAFNRFQHLNNLFKEKNYFCCPAAMIRRSTFEKLGYYPRFLRQIHDMAHWIRMLFYGDLVILPDRVLKFRIRRNNANAGSETPENRRRINFEIFENLQQFVENIRDIDLLVKIFPEVRQHRWPLEDRLVSFHLAHIALAQPSSVHRLFGLDLLYKLMSDRATADHLESRCGFDYPDLYRLEGERPVFADYAELGKDEAQLLKELELLRQMLTDGQAHREQLESAYNDLINSASWKVTSLLRKARSVLSK